MELRYAVPALGGVAARRRRAAARDLEVRLTLSLRAGESFLRVAATVHNQRDDHRLRLAIRTDLKNAVAWSDAAFGAVRREPLTLDAAELRMEHAPRTAPLHRYVSLFDARAGATLYSDGLAEYEATDDGAVLVTLLRAVGELSRNDLPERPGHAGWPTSTPEAQCHGTFEANFALMLHGARDAAVIDRIERTADDVLLPLAGSTLRSALEVPAPTAGVSLHGTGLAFSACKIAEAGNGLVLRCVNLLDVDQRGRWDCGFRVAEARLARLDETSGEPLNVEGCVIAFGARAHETVTIVAKAGG
jgi:alpha-mannosidase